MLNAKSSLFRRIAGYFGDARATVEAPSEGSAPHSCAEMNVGLIEDAASAMKTQSSGPVAGDTSVDIPHGFSLGSNTASESQEEPESLSYQGSGSWNAQHERFAGCIAPHHWELAQEVWEFLEKCVPNGGHWNDVFEEADMATYGYVNNLWNLPMDSVFCGRTDVPLDINVKPRTSSVLTAELEQLMSLVETTRWKSIVKSKKYFGLVKREGEIHAMPVHLAFASTLRLATPFYEVPYGWASKFFIAPLPPGFVDYAMKALELVDRFFPGGNHLQTLVITVKKVTETSETHRLKVFVDPTHRYHDLAESLRLELDAISAESEQQVTDSSECEVDAHRESTSVLVTSDVQAENAPESHPCVEVLSDVMRKKLITLARGAGEDEESRKIERLIKRLSNEAILRPLAAIDAGSMDVLLNETSFPHFGVLFEYLRKQFMLASVSRSVLRLPPILLLGDPGIGKTEWLSRFAENVKTDLVKVNMASAQTGSFLTGSDSFWSNSKPGRLFEALAFGKAANPIVFLDELDKAVGYSGMSSVSGLYDLLERRSAAEFEDLALPGIKMDASHTVWFAAANDVNGIEPALLSRFKVFSIPAPTPGQLPAVAQSVYASLISSEPWGCHFWPGDAKSKALSDSASGMGTPGPMLPPAVAARFQEISARLMRRVIESACANAIQDGRNYLTEDDIDLTGEGRARRRIGF